MPADNEIIEIDYHQLEQGDTVHVTLDEGEIECQFLGLKEFDGLDDEQVVLRHNREKYYINHGAGETLWQREECWECAQMRWTRVATVVDVTSPAVTPAGQQTLDEITS